MFSEVFKNLIRISGEIKKMIEIRIWTFIERRDLGYCD